MNHQLWTAVGARVLAMTFVAAGAVACGEDVADRTARAGNGDGDAVVASNNGAAASDVFAGAGGEVSPSAKVIGVAPAEPEAETGTASPSGATPEAKEAPPKDNDKIDGVLNQQQESTQRPAPGDNHGYSTVAPLNPQKSEGVDPQQLPSRGNQQ